jgi:hypothetical protein
MIIIFNFRYPYFYYMITIYMHMIIVIIKCNYYPLFVYEVISILNYYLNLYVKLKNNAVVIV